MSKPSRAVHFQLPDWKVAWCGRKPGGTGGARMAAGTTVTADPDKVRECSLCLAGAAKQRKLARR